MFIGVLFRSVECDVDFRFIPSAENILVAIKNKTDHEIKLVRKNTEYIDIAGESLGIHYGYDYVQEVVSFSNGMHVSEMNITSNSEITGYAWINNRPDFHIGQGPGNIPISTYNGEYVRDYTFTFKIDDVIYPLIDKN